MAKHNNYNIERIQITLKARKIGTQDPLTPRRRKLDEQLSANERKESTARYPSLLVMADFDIMACIGRV
jgi:hypothetical protein